MDAYLDHEAFACPHVVEVDYQILILGVALGPTESVSLGTYLLTNNPKGGQPNIQPTAIVPTPNTHEQPSHCMCSQHLSSPLRTKRLGMLKSNMPDPSFL